MSAAASTAGICLAPRWYFVAQTVSLLYRRMPSCRTAPWPGRWNTAKGLPICNRRYGRLAICATLNRYQQQPRRQGLAARFSGLSPVASDVGKAIHTPLNAKPSMAVKTRERDLARPDLAAGEKKA